MGRISLRLRRGGPPEVSEGSSEGSASASAIGFGVGSPSRLLSVVPSAFRRRLAESFEPRAVLLHLRHDRVERGRVALELEVDVEVSEGGGVPRGGGVHAAGVVVRDRRANRLGALRARDLARRRSSRAFFASTDAARPGSSRASRRSRRGAGARARGWPRRVFPEGCGVTHAVGSWFSSTRGRRGFTRGMSTARDEPIARSDAASGAARVKVEGAGRLSRRHRARNLRGRRGGTARPRERFPVPERFVPPDDPTFRTTFTWTCRLPADLTGTTEKPSATPGVDTPRSLGRGRGCPARGSPASRSPPPIARRWRTRSARRRSATPLTHKLSSREEALLASLKSELLREAAAGRARVGGPPSKPARASAAPSTKPPSGAVKRYDTLDELEADDEEAEDEEAPGASVERGGGDPPAGGVKTYMSKAERRRLKKHRGTLSSRGRRRPNDERRSRNRRNAPRARASEEGPPSARAKAERVAGEGGAARSEARSSRRRSPSGSSIRRPTRPRASTTNRSSGGNGGGRRRTRRGRRARSAR